MNIITDMIATQTRIPTTQPAMTPATLDEESPSPVPASIGTLIIVVTASMTKGLSVVLELLFSPFTTPVVVAVAVVIVIDEGVTTLVPACVDRTSHIQCTSHGYFETINIVEAIMTSPQSHVTIHKAKAKVGMARKNVKNTITYSK